MFTLGLSSYSYGWAVANNQYTPSTLLDKAKTFGLHLVQFGDNLPLHVLDKATLAALGHQAEQLSISIETGTKGFTEETLARYAEISQSLGATFMRILIDDGEKWQPDTNTVYSIFKTMESTLAACNVRVGIENHDRFRCADLAKLVRKADSRYLGICLDTVNSLGAAESLEMVLDTLLPYAINIHIKDFLIRRFPHKQGFEIVGCPCGTGWLKVDEVIKKLAAYPEKPHLIFEQWVSPETTMDATIMKEAFWAETGIAYLQSLPELSS